ncbi:hypothetical protein AB5J62_43095 [Amycolatopsis sp. cg5]|uniref:hypothetical protein n=1 Tax=Amycolatopsis sp. cg5 TaxID=3238802 RepID=UPI0035245512
MSSTEISYYALADSGYDKGPAGLIRRRPDAGGHVDEVFSPRTGTWRPTDLVSKYYLTDRVDEDLVLITAAEADAVTAWFGDRSTRPPLLGGRSLAEAWRVRLTGDIPFEALRERLGLEPHGSPADGLERDPGFRVLRNDESARLSLNVYVAPSGGWSVALEFLGEAPSAAAVAEVRAEVLSAAAELGFTATDEQTGTDAKSFSASPLPPLPRPIGVKKPRHQLFRLTFTGSLDKEQLKALQQKLRLSDDGDLTDEEDTEFGETYLPHDLGYRPQLWLSRADTERWTFGISNEGIRPPEEHIRQWHDQVVEAATEAGLALAEEWQSPTPPNPTPLPEPPVRTGLPVESAYYAGFAGSLTQERLEAIRERFGLSRRGKLDDDWDTDFGVVRLRDEPGTPVKLNFDRRAEDKWSFSVTYQGEPPAPELLERVRSEIAAAAAEAGLTIEREVPGSTS